MMDLLKAFQQSGFAGVGTTIGTSLKKTGSLNGLSEATTRALNIGRGSAVQPAAANNPFAPSLSTKILITIGLSIVGVAAVKRLI